MKERPILFSGPMVRAILEGRKTKTRRVVKRLISGRVKETSTHRNWHLEDPNALRACPYGQPGDLLWVRETHCFRSTAIDFEVNGEEDLPTDGRPVQSYGDYSLVPIYKATEKAELDYSDDPRDGCQDCEDGNPHGHWHPSIHMPRWACRIVLEIKEVRIQRVQEISEEDAKAEGIVPLEDLSGPNKWTVNMGGHSFNAPTAKEVFQMLWDSINEERGFGWEKDPWVWAIEFKRVAGNP